MKKLDNIKEKIFREYDLRGIYQEDIDEDVAYTLGLSFGSFIQEKGYHSAIVGYDNRHSSVPLNEALIKGMLETGIAVYSLGLVTTPMYYFARYYLKEDCGIMITASHNPKEYNGFKIAFDSIGNAYGDKIQEFKEFTKKGNFLNGEGILLPYDIKDAYLEQIKQSVSFGSRKVKAVIDCGNGTGSIIIRDIFDMLQIPYDALYCESDGDFPNHHPDPSVKENMLALSKRVVELGYDLGIGIDGDADRVGIVLENGEIIGADLYMLIMYQYLEPSLKERKALFDVKCSRTLIDGIKSLGLEPIMNRTGNSYINMMMKEGNFDFGGEYSGHVFFRDKFPGFDDGIYAGLRMIELLSHKSTPLSMELLNRTKYYSTDEIKIKVTEETKFTMIDQVKSYAKEKGYQVIALDGARIEFTDGWALLRASNTGPNITARFEATTETRLKEIQEEFLILLEQLQRL